MKFGVHIVVTIAQKIKQNITRNLPFNVLYIYIYIYTHTHIYTYTHTHTHIYIYNYVNKRCRNL